MESWNHDLKSNSRGLVKQFKNDIFSLEQLAPLQYDIIKSQELAMKLKKL